MAYGNRYGERYFAPLDTVRPPTCESVCGGYICSACGCGILAGDVGWAAHLAAHHSETKESK
jgi:ferredoxin